MSSRRRSSSSSENGIKYAPGVGARVPPEQRPLGALEWGTLAHVAVYVVGTTWAFGGGHESLRSILAWWGSLGLLITLTALQDREAWRDGWMRPLSWLLPLVAFNALVLLASLNPSFREVKFDADIMLVQGGERTGLPSSARPGDALHGLWLFDARWISAFNLALVLRQRRALDFPVVAPEVVFRRADVTKTEGWRWTVSIAVPDMVEAADVRRAVRTVRERHPETPLLDRVKFSALPSGTQARIMHVGPYDQEQPTVDRLLAFVREAGYRPGRAHIEVYLSDSGRVSPDRTRTVIRMPVTLR